MNGKLLIGLPSVGGIALVAEVAGIAPSSDEMVWLWRAFVSLLLMLSGMYIRMLYRKLDKAVNAGVKAERMNRHLKHLVDMLAKQAKESGKRRDADILLIALADEMEADLERNGSLK